MIIKVETARFPLPLLRRPRSCAPPLPIHEGYFLKDKRVIAGGLGDGRLGRVHEVPRGVFNPVEEGMQFDALVVI